ncbi:MAG: CvpA family protein [Alphaproteobacteria bacterium]|nr:CvpA family protein [Alphaproteobacteria bacterium]
MVIGLIDIIVLITLTLSILFALYRGLVCELLCISSWILAGFGALYTFAPMKNLLSGVFENQMLAGVVGSGIIVLVILVVMTIINAQITKRLRSSSLSGLDRILGLFFGVLRAALLLSLLYIGGTMILSEKQLEGMEKENFSMPYIQKTVDLLKYFVPENVLTDLNVNKDEKTEEKQPKIGAELKREKQPKNTNTKALENLVKEVKKPSKLKPIEVKKEVPQEAVNYKPAERKSLDNMIEAIAGE